MIGSFSDYKNFTVGVAMWLVKVKIGSLSFYNDQSITSEP
jgi:hypothetical protein